MKLTRLKPVDDAVVLLTRIQGTERLVNRLVELGKPFDMMVYPNRSHSISEGKGTALHIYSLIARYIRDHL